MQDTSTWKYRRGVVRRRHFGIVHKQNAFFSNYDGDIVGLVQRKKWYKPWAVHTTSFDVDVSPGLVVPGMPSAILVLAILPCNPTMHSRICTIRGACLCRHTQAGVNDALQHR